MFLYLILLTLSPSSHIEGAQMNENFEYLFFCIKLFHIPSADRKVMTYF